MGHLFFTRHGETVWNVENKICGVTDSDLTEKGCKQAAELGQMIADENLDIDEILYSPLIRAKKTALFILEKTGIPAFEEKRLTEQCFGKYEGTPRNGKEFAEAKKSFINSYDGGESMMKLAHRIYGLLDDVTSDDKKVRLLVAHNGIARVIRSYFYDMTNEEYAAFGIKNCEILRFDY